MEKIRNKKIVNKRSKHKSSIMKKKLLKSATAVIDEPNISTLEPIEIIDVDANNSLSIDELLSTKTVSSKDTVPNITIDDEIIDITNISIENVQTIPHKKTAQNIDYDDIIDITDMTVTSDDYEDVSIQFSSDDDVQIIDVPTVQNNSIELITILDDSDEENTPNQQPIEKPTSLSSINERLGISTKATIKSSYISPLRNRKRAWDDENKPKLDSLGNNLGAFVIDRRKMSKHTRYPNTFKHNAVQFAKPQVSSSVTTSGTNRKLRPIIIDGLNIGHAHGSGMFSGKGIELCIQFFTDLGHTDVVAFIPQHRQGPPGSESNTILNKLVKKGQICFTPSRKVQNLRMTCYDDRIILNYAHKCGGVVVSNDNYRDLYDENEAFKDIIENRQVMVTFVRDQIIVPEDQYNRKSTVRSLSDILCFPA